MVPVPADRTSPQQRRPLYRTRRLLTTIGGVIVFGILLATSLTLIDARRDASVQALRAERNIAVTIEREIARNIELFRLSLEAARDGINQPGVAELSPELRDLVLFDRSATARYLGGIFLMSPTGDIEIDSRASSLRHENFADRDYFIAQRDRDAGLYISRPFTSRLNGDLNLGISLRRTAPNGGFAGVALGSLHIQYFRDIFDSLELGPRASITLLRTDGTLIARHPFNPTDVGGVINLRSDLLVRAHAQSFGQYKAVASFDGVSRLYTFMRIGDLPLIVVVGFDIDDVYRTWEHKASVIGTITVVLCVALIALILILRRELERRLGAERALHDANAELLTLATTDPLTRLGNRRLFDDVKSVEWRRAARGCAPISLLLLDIDFFKSYNDHYGHQAGDEALRAVGECIARCLRRPGDFGGRYGGEEFVVLLPTTDVAGAGRVAAALHQSLADLGIEHAASPLGRLSMSIGAACSIPDPADPVDAFVGRADAALYAAKNAGRDGTRFAPSAADPHEHLAVAV